MNLASETVRTFLASIGVTDPAALAGLANLGEARAVETLRLRIIAHAKAHSVTGSRLYADALKSLDALLRSSARFATKADPLFEEAAKRYAGLKTAAEKAVVRWEWWTGSTIRITGASPSTRRSSCSIADNRSSST